MKNWNSKLQTQSLPFINKYFNRDPPPAKGEVGFSPEGVLGDEHEVVVV
jgi:hypothetical protein